MAARLEPLNLRITGSAAGLSSALGKARGDVGQFSAGIEQQASRISGALGSIAAFALPAGITAGLGVGVKLAADAQDAELSFKALTGSAENASRVLAELNAFSASTPFSFADDVKPAAQQLLTYGFTVDELQTQLRVLGNVAAVSGTDFAELAKLIGRARSTNLIFTEDLNQLSDRAIPVLDLLAERFGVTAAEVRKLASEGKIQYADLAAVLEYLGGEGGKFGDALQERSEALNGVFSTLKDNVSLLATDIGGLLVPTITLAVGEMTEMVQYLQSFDAGTAEGIVKAAAFTTALAGTALVLPRLVALGKELVLAIRAIGTASTIAQALSGPAGWASIAVGLAVAGSSVYAVDQLFDSLNDTQANTVATGNQVAASQAEIAKRTIEAGDAAKTAAQSQEKWQRTAESLRKSLETPAEKYAREIGELSAAVREGGLEWEFFERGVAKAIAALDGAQASANKLKRPEAKLSGSEAAEDAIFAFRSQIPKDDNLDQRVAAESVALRDSIAKADAQAIDMNARLAEANALAAEANVDRLADGFERAKREATELAGKARELSDLSYDRRSFTGQLNTLGSQLRSLPSTPFGSDGVYLDESKAARFDAAKSEADIKLQDALKQQEELTRAQAEAEAARQAAADARAEQLLANSNTLLNNVADAIRNTPEPQPLDL